MEEVKYKIILKYSRGGAARYISHLDMQRAFGRAVRRAQLPAEYSQGFNPHIVMSFASPLSVGYATNGDYVELTLTGQMDGEEIMRALNAVLPPDIRILHVRPAAQNEKKLMANNYSASYTLHFHFENEKDCVKIVDATERLRAAKRYVTEDRRGRELDIRPLILGIGTEDGKTVSMRLKNASDGALNPAVVLAVLEKETGRAADCDICREDCFAYRNGEEIPFSNG